MTRLIMLAALVLSVVGGLIVMSGASPLAAQATPSATRALDSDEVTPGGTVEVTITLSDVTANLGTVTETLPSGFAYVSSSLDAAQVSQSGQDVTFTTIGEASFTYTVTASGTEASYSFSGELSAGGSMYSVGGDSSVTVDAGAPPPEPPPPGPLNLPDLDSDAAGLFSAPADSGNDVEYTARDGDDDAKVSVRVGPDAEAIVNIDLDITVPSDKQVNFSLTDGDNLPFQVKKTGDATAAIVVRAGMDVTSHAFQLVVNEQGNAPANTQDIDIEVTVVIDNVAPTFVNAPSTGSIDERAQGATIATFSATDVNNQVLEFSLSNDAPSWVMIGEYNGVLMTGSSDASQPDYDEDNPGDNTHTFKVIVSDGTLDADTDFHADGERRRTDPPVGSNQKLRVNEDNAGGAANSFGTAPDLDSSGDFSIDQQIDNQGNITIDSDDILFGVVPATGAIYLKDAGSINYESGVTAFTVSISRADGGSGVVVINVDDVNEAPTFSDVRQCEDNADRAVRARVGRYRHCRQHRPGRRKQPDDHTGDVQRDDQDGAATGYAIAYDLWDEDGNLYAGKGAMFDGKRERDHFGQHAA